MNTQEQLLSVLPRDSSSLLDLNDDILLTIISSSTETGGDVDLALSMSLVCKRLRAISLAHLFRVVCWPNGRDKVDFYPSSLWPYIRHFTFLQVQWRSQHLKSMEMLSNSLPHLHNLMSFVYVDQKFGPTLSFVSSLALSFPSLVKLEISTVFFSHDAVDSFREFSGLQRLLVKQPEGITLATAPVSKRSMSLQCVANIIFACYETLNHVELPGEFLPLEMLLSGPNKLVSLRTLVLHGYPPLNAEAFPIRKIFLFTPRLSKLEILFKVRVVGARLRRYALMPFDVSPVQGDFIFPSSLDSLSIANPMMEDRVFRHLPPYLKTLTLDFIPELENIISSKDTLAYHRPQRMLWFLRNMNMAEGPPPDLESLCIKMGWCATPDILACMSQLFPNLKVLELQGLRYVDRTEEPYSDMDACVSHLTHLQLLQTLKLAMELPEDPYEYSASADRPVGSVEQASWKWAKALALQLPNIRHIAFERRPHVGKTIGPRVLSGHPDWVWFEVKNGVPERQTSAVDHHWNLMRKRRPTDEYRYTEVEVRVPGYKV